MIFMIHNINKTNIEAWDLKIEDLVIGFFDGLHQGHTHLFDDIKKTTVLTFITIPKKNRTLYPLEERVQQLKRLGIKDIIIYDLKDDNCTAYEFVKKYLYKLNPKRIIVGSDFVFGSDQKDVTILKDLFNCKIVKTDKFSSSLIKNKINYGKIKAANAALIQPYYRSSQVIQGQQHGRVLGFPTINFILDQKLVNIYNGVYITNTIIDSKPYPSVTFVGRPLTIDENREVLIETYIINFKQDLYGKKLSVVFNKFLMEPKKFKDEAELKINITKYVNSAKKYHKLTTAHKL